MIGYAVMSFRNIIRNSKLFVIFLIITQFFSVIVIVFSYGIVNHYNTKVDVAESTSRSHDFVLKNEYKTGVSEDYLQHNDVDSFIKEVIPNIEAKLDYFFIMGHSEEYRVMSSTGYSNGRYTVSSQIKNKVWIKEGEIFVEDDEEKGNYCILATQELIDGSGFAMIGEERYTIKGVVGTEGLDNAFYVPYKAFPENANIYYISLLLREPLLETEFNSIVEAAERCFGDKMKYPQFEGIINESSNRVYRDIMFVSIALILVFAIDYCVIYQFILEKRRRIFAVSRICGGSKVRLGMVYLIELLGISIATLLLGVGVFDIVLLPKAISIFEYIDIYCNNIAYLRLGVIYIIILLVVYVILILRFVKRTPVSLIRGI